MTMLRFALLALSCLAISPAPAQIAPAPPPAVQLPPDALAPPPPAASPTTPLPPAPPPPAEAKPLGPAAAAPDAFGEEVTLTEKTIVFVAGHANWDSAFETLVKSFKTLNDYLDKQGLKPSGPAMTIYTQTDDTGFGYRAALPVGDAPKTPPPAPVSVGKSPSGKALKFVHRGSYDAMDTTYEAITNHLDEKNLEAKDLFVEEYEVDPAKTAADKMVVNVFVPIN